MMEIQEVSSLGKKITASVATVIAGKDDVILLAVMALFAGGHMLLDDVPGTGKTMLSKTLAKTVGGEFRRVQFTPDLLPSDLTGINYFNQKLGDFVFRRGPVFTNVLLADEINRAAPRTQSSLLECMEERQVTVDGTTYPLARPYFVIATQNPVETQGTFPLPEAQLDRFLIKTSVGYPSAESAVEILRRGAHGSPYDGVSPVCGAEEVVAAQEAVRGVYVHPDLMAYIAALAEKTRTLPEAALGVSPRGSLALMAAAKARAALSGRGYVVPEDIRSLARPVFAHRLIMRDSFASGGEKAAAAVEAVLAAVEVPSEKWDLPLQTVSG